MMVRVGLTPSVVVATFPVLKTIRYNEKTSQHLGETELVRELYP